MNCNSAGRDLVLISDYGRSGQGWLSYMLCYILNARFVEPYDMLKGRVYSQSSHVLGLTQGRLPGREPGRYAMIVKTHEYPAPDFTLYDKVIHLMRDPRDVAVSAYFRQKVLMKQRNSGGLKKKIKSALSRAKLLSFLLTARGWRKHFARWESVPVFRVKYEDLWRDTKGTLRLILRYLEVPNVDEALVDEAVSNFAFEKITGRTKGTEDSRNMEFRKGIVGDFRNHFGPSAKFLFRFVCGNEARRAGYDL